MPTEISCLLRHGYRPEARSARLRLGRIARIQVFQTYVVGLKILACVFLQGLMTHTCGNMDSANNNETTQVDAQEQSASEWVNFIMYICKATVH